MSANTIAEALPTPQPDTLGAPQTPAACFADHVAWVRESGDAYDQHPGLSYVRNARAKALMGIASGLLAVGEAGQTMQSFVEVGGTLTMGAIVIGAVSKLRHGAVRRRVITRTDPAAGEAVRQRYELIRTRDRGKPAEVSLLWLGPEDQSDLPPEERRTYVESLRDMAGLCEQAGVTRMLVPHNLHDLAVGHVAEAPEQPQSTLQRWLRRRRGIHLSGQAEKIQVAEAAPAFYLEHAYHRQRPEEGSTVNTLLEQIAGLRSDHHAVALGQKFASKPDMQRDKLFSLMTATLQQAASAELGIVAPEDRHSGSFVRHQREEGHTALDGETVYTFVNGQLREAVPLLTKFGLNEERLQQLLQSKDPSLARERLEALELALYRSLLRRETSAALGQTTKEWSITPLGQSGLSRPQMDIAVADGRAANSVRLHRRMVRAVSGAVAVAAAMITGVGAGEGDQYYQHRAEAAAMQIAQAQDLPSAASVTAAQIRGRLPGALQVWGEGRQARQRMRTILFGHGDNLPEPLLSYNSGSAGIRNVNNSARVVWSLNAHNMATDGMYVTNTWKDLLACPPGQQPASCPPSRLGWISSPSAMVAGKVRQLPAQATPQTVPEMARAAQPWMQVSGEVDQSDFVQDNPDSNIAYLGLPMLPNTVVTAANFNGKPVDIVEMVDGTYDLRLTNAEDQIEGRHANVQFWFEPAAAKASPHQFTQTRQGTERAGTTFYEYDAAGRAREGQASLAGIDQVFQQYIPGYNPAASPDAKRQLVYDYLQSDFRYTLDPISAKEQAQIYDWKSFASNVLQRKLAQCNVAVPLLVLADPNLSAATGYDNAKGGGSNVLTEQERHIVALGGSQLIDAQPTVLAKDPAGHDGPLAPWLIVLAAVQLGGVLVVDKERARQILGRQHARYLRYAAERADKRLQAMGALHLQHAAEIVGESAWSFDHQADVEAAEARAKAQIAGIPRQRAVDAALDRVRQPLFRDPAALQRLTAHPAAFAKVAPVYKEAVKAARRPPHYRTRK
jgi:hypothetical protein